MSVLNQVHHCLPRPPPSPFSFTPLLAKAILQFLKLHCPPRQQLEEIRIKQEHQEVLGSKRRKENREQNQGESAGEKSRYRAGLRSFPAQQACRSHQKEKTVEVLRLFFF